IAVMARVFTTPFEFYGKTYYTVVTSKVDEGKMNFNVQIPDLNLHRFIPEGKFQFDTEDGCKQPELLENVIARSIVQIVTNAIYKHLEKVSPDATVSGS